MMGHTTPDAFVSLDCLHCYMLPMIQLSSLYLELATQYFNYCLTEATKTRNEKLCQLNNSGNVLLLSDESH